METVETKRLIDDGQRQRRRPASKAELYSALEALLPFAKIEIEWLADSVTAFPDDDDHAEDSQRVKHGKEAIDLANRLIAMRSSYLTKKKQQHDVQGQVIREEIEPETTRD